MLAVTLLVIACSVLSALFLAAVSIYAYRLRSNNIPKRKVLLEQLGFDEENDVDNRTVVGFFHPYCNAGGGGERVLWTAIACLQREEKEVVCVVYTGDAVDVSKEAMIAKVENRFGITLDPKTLAFVPLTKRYLVEDTTWTRFTLIGQSLGSVFLAMEGLEKGIVPDIWIDTMGYAFAYPLVRLVCRIPVGSYTHYPTISTDMLKRVRSRQAGHTNPSAVAKSFVLTYLKLGYYILFAEAYSLCLRQATVLMVNSTWTKRHINRLLRPLGHRDDGDADEKNEPDHTLEGSMSELKSNAGSQTSAVRRRGNLASSTASTLPPRVEPPRFRRAQVVYPPCDTIALCSLPLEARESIILSVAQFRPEKEHHIQLRALKLFLSSSPSYASREKPIKLILAGSVRNSDDEKRVEDLRSLAKELEIEEFVEFQINVPYPTLLTLFGRCSIGLHTMIDEHFGITVVEFMAAGLLPLVHASAGPLLDIVTPYASLPTGYHATDATSFAAQLSVILALGEHETREMRVRARKSASERFALERFERGWLEGWGRLVREREGREGPEGR